MEIELITIAITCFIIAVISGGLNGGLLAYIKHLRRRNQELTEIIKKK